jgi:hypothetical protein
MAGRLNDPESSIPKEVERLFEWAKALPLALQLCAPFCRFLWMEEVRIPLALLVVGFARELPGRAMCKRSRTKISSRIGKHGLDRSRVIPVVMTAQISVAYTKASLEWIC